MTPSPKPDESRRFDRWYESKLDTALYLLAHGRRRLAIELLQRRDGPVTRDELVDWISTVEFGEGERPVRREREIRLEVMHTHLPKLVAAGVVEEEDDGYAYLGDPLVEELLDSLDEFESPPPPGSG